MINPKIPDEELEAFSIAWNKLLIERGAEIRVTHDKRVKPTTSHADILALLRDCHDFVSSGNASTASINLIGRIEKYTLDE